MAGKSSRAAWIAVLLALAVVAAVVVTLCVRGCRRGEGPGRGPEGYDRTEDPEYANELKGVIEARKPLVKARNQTVSTMKDVIAKARAALPAGASDEEVKAELEGHPEKYPEWKGLSEQILRDNAAIEDSLKDAQSRVRARIMKEQGSQAKSQKAAPGGKKNN